MNRRQFLKQVGQGLVAGWVASQIGGLGRWGTALAGGVTARRIAYLSDAHLVDGDDQRPQARALSRAVAEINALRPLPALALFGGDLAHEGHPEALALGHRMLSGLQMPLLMLMGEHDGSPQPGQPWPRRFGAPQFSHRAEGCHILGVHTYWEPDPVHGGVFRVGEAQCEWLRAELARVPRAMPLVVCSHAPLYKLYRPWQYWTEDAEAVLTVLSPFASVTFLHGHVHHDLPMNQGNWTARGLPALAWPRPDVRQGTPAVCPPPEADRVGHRGCGWGLLTLGPGGLISATSHLWTAG